MQLAKVIGKATATVKHSSLNGSKMLIVVPLMADGQSADGFPQLAIDGVGAGPGEVVLITSDGEGARAIVGAEITPVRWTVVGIKDS